jgi:DNA replication protein DnaC
MLTQPTIEKLYELRLGSMASAFVEQQKDAKIGSLSFDERFAMLVDAEHLARDNRRVKALLKEAELRIGNACIEDVDASAQRGIDKGLLRQLATCAWIDQNQNTLITGATGTGKSYLACALGQTACRRGLRVIYRRMPRLLDELALAKADGSYAKTLRKLARAQLLPATTSASAIRPTPSATTCSRSSRTATAPVPPSSPASYPAKAGTNGSGTRPSPTPSWTASSTTPTRSN